MCVCVCGYGTKYHDVLRLCLKRATLVCVPVSLISSASGENAKHQSPTKYPAASPTACLRINNSYLLSGALIRIMVPFYYFRRSYYQSSNCKWFIGWFTVLRTLVDSVRQSGHCFCGNVAPLVKMTRPI